MVLMLVSPVWHWRNYLDKLTGQIRHPGWLSRAGHWIWRGQAGQVKGRAWTEGQRVECGRHVWRNPRFVHWKRRPTGVERQARRWSLPLQGIGCFYREWQTSSSSREGKAQCSAALGEVDSRVYFRHLLLWFCPTGPWGVSCLHCHLLPCTN